MPKREDNGEGKEDEEVYQECFKPCRLLAENGFTILNGGGPGVMRAATEGTHAGGGKAIGVTFYPKYPHAHFEGRDMKNLIDEEIITQDYFSRTKELLVRGHCHLVFKGGTGTISEFGMSWASARIHEGHSIPLILFGHFWHDIIGAFKGHMYMRPDEFKLYSIVETPEEVLDFVRSLKERSPS